MFYFNGKKKGKKKSKEDQMDEEYKTAFTKVDGFYKNLHSINTELKQITEHNAVITNPNQKRQISIIADLNLFQKQESKLILLSS